MSRKWMMVLLLGLLPLACSDDDGSSTNDNDAGVVQDSGVGEDGGQVIECTPTVDQCPAGLDCLCCGSIGPAAICVCSTACDSDADCTDPDLPHCNQPGAGTAGICTTPEYNCCWECQ